MPPLPKYSNTMALQLYFNASDNVSGIARLELWYRVNGGAYQQYSGNLTTSPLAFAATSDGLYEFYLRGLDNAGNYEAVPVTADANVTVKTSVPEPVVKIKEGTDTTESSAHVSGTVEPGSSVQVNGKAVTVDAAGNYAATVALSEGANKIKVTVTDPAGNTKTVEKTVNRKAASPMMTWLILALVIIIVAVVAAVLALRMRGKKPAPAEARAEPDRTAPPEAVAVPDQPAPEELPK
jgi:multisubunit Na+/H+ antiporter MnhC subunit